MLATTGGGSRLRGTQYGEFDHIVWITMKKDGPLMANIMMNGILPENLQQFVSDEEGVKDYYRRPTHPVVGKVVLNGQPVAGACGVFASTAKEPRPPRADAFTEADGSFVLSTYEAGDGAPVGDYKVTVVWRKPFYAADGKPGPNRLPEKFSKADTSG